MNWEVDSKTDLGRWGWTIQVDFDRLITVQLGVQIKKWGTVRHQPTAQAAEHIFCSTEEYNSLPLSSNPIPDQIERKLTSGNS